MKIPAGSHPAVEETAGVAKMKSWLIKVKSALSRRRAGG